MKVHRNYVLNKFEEHKKIKIGKLQPQAIINLCGLTMGIFCPSNAISQSLTKPKFNEINKFSNQSFITKAVETTGSSVVTIDTQRFVKRRKFPRNSQLFLDPYFERFFGLDLPNDNQPRIEQSQGSGFILRRRPCND